MGPSQAMVMAANRGNSPAPAPTPTPAPTPSGVDGLGKFFAAAQALTSIAQVFGGFSARSSANNEAEALRMEADQLVAESNAQAQIAIEESRLEAAQKAREATKFRQKQAAMYLKSGVTLEGTPALVLEETRRLAQQEVDAITKRGQAQADYIKLQGETSKVMLKRAAALERSGRNSLLGSVLGAGADSLASYVMWKRISRQNPNPTPVPSPSPAPAPAPKQTGMKILQPIEDRIQ